MGKFNRRSLFTWAGSIVSTSACKTLTSSGLRSEQDDSAYDYIIVGSGAGGGPLAVNLSKAGFRVLLLEAGTDQGKNPNYQVPAFHTQSTEDKDMSWDFYVNHFKNLNEDRIDHNFTEKEQGILYPRAGTLGGCTAHNAMITVYPLAKDWTNLCTDVGDQSFNPNAMRKYFSFTENASYHSDPARKKGWLPVRFASPTLVVKDKSAVAMVLAALRSMDKGILRHFSRIKSAFDLITLPDLNSLDPDRDEKEGLVMIPTAITSDGKRYSVRDLLMDKANNNLVIRMGCLVTRVLFSEASLAKGQPEAIGVEYIVGDKIYKASKNPNPASSARTSVYAKKEVILAGGTFNTPQILMNSGIGPKADLKKFEGANYKVILDRPGVGKNLQDRYEIGVVTETPTASELLKSCTFKPNSSDPCFTEWKNGNGVYTANGGIIGILKKSYRDEPNPDLFIFLFPAEFRGYYPGYSKAVEEKKNRMTWVILKAQTSNRGGQLMIESLDPTARPKINFNYYQDGTDNKWPLNGDMDASVKDLESLVEGVEYVREIIADANKVRDVIETGDVVSGVLGTSDTEYYREVIPGLNNASNKDQLREWVRRRSWGHHACGTCKMGKKDDPLAVVDSRFRVIGTKNLRIVDASLFPRIPGYFIVTSIYAMSEKASDDILQDAGVARRVKV